MVDRSLTHSLTHSLTQHPTVPPKFLLTQQLNQKMFLKHKPWQCQHPSPPTNLPTYAKDPPTLPQYLTHLHYIPETPEKQILALFTTNTLTTGDNTNNQKNISAKHHTSQTPNKLSSGTQTHTKPTQHINTPKQTYTTITGTSKNKSKSKRQPHRQPRIQEKLSTNNKPRTTTPNPTLQKLSLSPNATKEHRHKHQIHKIYHQTYTHKRQPKQKQLKTLTTIKEHRRIQTTNTKQQQNSSHKSILIKQQTNMKTYPPIKEHSEKKQKVNTEIKIKIQKRKDTKPTTKPVTPIKEHSENSTHLLQIRKNTTKETQKQTNEKQTETRDPTIQKTQKQIQSNTRKIHTQSHTPPNPPYPPQHPESSRFNATNIQQTMQQDNSKTENPPLGNGPETRTRTTNTKESQAAQTKPNALTHQTPSSPHQPSNTPPVKPMVLAPKVPEPGPKEGPPRPTLMKGLTPNFPPNPDHQEEKTNKKQTNKNKQKQQDNQNEDQNNETNQPQQAGSLPPAQEQPIGNVAAQQPKAEVANPPSPFPTPPNPNPFHDIPTFPTVQGRPTEKPQGPGLVIMINKDYPGYRNLNPTARAMMNPGLLETPGETLLPPNNDQSMATRGLPNRPNPTGNILPSETYGPPRPPTMQNKNRPGGQPNQTLHLRLGGSVPP
jgi:hypothetical protein